MRKFLIGAILGLVLGGIGAFMTMGSLVGASLGAGAGTGLVLGICTTVKAGQELGIMTADQVDEILAKATTMFGDGTEIPPGTEIAGTAAQCDAALARIKAAAEQ